MDARGPRILMHQRTHATSLRRAAHPLTLAIVVAVAGVASAVIALAVRGHFTGVTAPPPVAVVTPSPTVAGTSPTASATVPQLVSGTLASTLVLAMSSDETGTITVDTGTPVQVTTSSGNTAMSVIAGGSPPNGNQGDGSIAGSTATPTTLVVTMGTTTVTLTIPQDSSVTGVIGRHTALQITAPAQ